MRYRSQCVPSLNPVHNGKGFVPCAAARSVGYRAVVRRGLQQSWKRLFKQSMLPLFGFRRKKLEGNHRHTPRAFLYIDVSHQLHKCLRCSRKRQNPSSTLKAETLRPVSSHGIVGRADWILDDQLSHTTLKPFDGATPREQSWIHPPLTPERRPGTNPCGQW